MELETGPSVLTAIENYADSMERKTGAG